MSAPLDHVSTPVYFWQTIQAPNFPRQRIMQVIVPKRRQMGETYQGRGRGRGRFAFGFVLGNQKLWMLNLKSYS